MNRVFECDFVISWKSREKEDSLWINKVEGHKFTVIDRLTDLIDGVREIESGYRDLDGKFWLASGGFDIRKHLPLNLNKAILLIKDNANACKGV